MTQTTFSAIIFTLVFSLATVTVFAKNHTVKTVTETTTSYETKAIAADQTDMAKKAPVLPESHSGAPAAKAHAPQMEELPHIHKFHKERVKKIKKHHGKYWLLSQLILVLCHLSILVIGYLHATH